MPLESYQKLHPEARLTQAESQEIIDWANALRKEIQAAHPTDFTEKSK